MANFANAVTDNDFETVVLGIRSAGAGRLLGRMVRAVPDDRSFGRSGRGRIRRQCDFVKMDVDDNQNYPQRYGIRGIPTLILFKGGQEQERIVGAVSRDAIAKVVGKYI